MFLVRATFDAVRNHSKRLQISLVKIKPPFTFDYSTELELTTTTLQGPPSLSQSQSVCVCEGKGEEKVFVSERQSRIPNSTILFARASLPFSPPLSPAPPTFQFNRSAQDKEPPLAQHYQQVLLFNTTGYPPPPLKKKVIQLSFI